MYVIANSPTLSSATKYLSNTTVTTNFHAATLYRERRLPEIVIERYKTFCGFDRTIPDEMYVVEIENNAT